jgi:hypothetical protein
MTNIVLEHVPLLDDETKRTNGAISHFRLYGYTNENAIGIPVALGEFDFGKLQESVSNVGIYSSCTNSVALFSTLDAFKTVAEFDIDSNMPFHSITLAVDSNHGSDYTCLYRFRVHGDEVVETNDSMDE